MIRSGSSQGILPALLDAGPRGCMDLQQNRLVYSVLMELQLQPCQEFRTRENTKTKSGG
ncbi:hypothetical protein MUK42_33447 [Musa troglodytarum]|uniref:Uncharacterized protein n=1 Tax=Musa troglodytarum TaxID=320322 RepID=A0A9E7H285_9LILI|nr:hypothetical protein MUK42_33447 [Musa troglodytarum]